MFAMEMVWVDCFVRGDREHVDGDDAWSIVVVDGNEEERTNAIFEGIVLFLVVFGVVF